VRVADNNELDAKRGWWRLKFTRWGWLSIWIVVFTAAVILAQVQLRQQQDQIERNQLRACQQTYRIISRILVVLGPALQNNPDLYERWRFTLALANPRRCQRTPE